MNEPLQRQNSRVSQSSIQTKSTYSQGIKNKLVSMKPKLKLKTDKEDYFEGDIINGQVKLGIKRDFGEFFLQIKLIKEESYVLFNKGGDQALASKEDSLVLSKEKITVKERYLPGSYFFQFLIQLPQTIEAATFYHSGKTLSAKIVYLIKVKITEFQQANQGTQEYKEMLPIRIINHVPTATVKKVLLDEAKVHKFLCFGGGISSIEAEYLRNTFSINPLKLNPDRNQVNTSIQSIYQNDLPAHDDDNIIEVKFKMNNRKNSIPVENIVVSLLQVVVLKEDLPNLNKKKIVQHVKEVLFCQQHEGLLANSYSEKNKKVQINLEQVQKLIMKRQSKEGIYGQLTSKEVKHRKGLQQTSTGDYIENFYLLRVQGIVKGYEQESPYVDNQIFLCFHEVPTSQEDSQIDNLVEKEMPRAIENSDVQPIIDQVPELLQDPDNVNIV